MEVHIIAMVCNQDSFLARKADHILYIPASDEADPLNLAPTTSTIAQMSMGDALAMALLSCRGFTVEDFARLHPGGQLGKKLTKKVEAYLFHNQKPQVKPDASIRDLIMEISSGRLGATAVVSASTGIKGIITDGDLRRMLQSEKDLSQIQALDIMTPDPKTIKQDERASWALEKMKANSITQLLVVNDEGNYVGIIHIHDLLKDGL